MKSGAEPVTSTPLIYAYCISWSIPSSLLSNLQFAEFCLLFKDCRIADGIEGKTERQVCKSTFNVSKV